MTNVDIERRGRFRYAVILHVPNGIDMALEPPCMFAWTAMGDRNVHLAAYRQAAITIGVVLAFLVLVAAAGALP